MTAGVAREHVRVAKALRRMPTIAGLFREGRLTRDGDGWVFTKPDGQACDWWVDDENLARHLDFALRRRQQLDQLAAADSFQHPDAQTIRPRWTGEPFEVHACVEALLTIKPPKHPPRP
jgi:hypothetical protein